MSLLLIIQVVACVVGIKSATRGATTGHDKSATTGRRQENGRRRMKTAVEASSNPCDSSHILQVRQLLPLVWSPNLGGVFFSFPLCWSEASVLQDGVNVLYEGEDCGGNQVRDPWRHHRPRQERHHWTETRERQTTNEDRSGSIKQPLRLVSYFTSPSTPPIAVILKGGDHQKMAITSEQRDLALAHLSQLAYSSNIAEYDLNLEVLQSSRMPLVVEYFLANWDNIRHEWVVGLTAQLLTLDQRTTNRLENINKQIKDTVTCLAALPAFFSEFFLYLASSRSERDQRAAIMIDTPVRSADPIELQFKEHLTDYAWKQMAEQFELAKQLSEAVTPDS
ncbi:hypothetical protein CAPTEDRAFT_206268 [Capitella teleta]|uniref:Uncharacterized protein n=1 Tax=Capitella teleta TaxID=283909 RepID=R7ULB5_CAPTE|nr:hypothetical protein CAPTEDRAFT_206268 [Capitella teleta]|eukprot:ELU04042.1 hypothetical protein CAPTEDRAFT_206268 [Capitella teleta]